jgi:rhomboid protease GluP
MNESSFKLVSAASTSRREQADHWSLVLWAMDIANDVVVDDTGYHINVSPHNIENARRQLAAYEAENSNWPPRDSEVYHEDGAARHPPIILLMGVLVLVYAVSGPWADHSPWFQKGAVMGEKILHHRQWWRVFTALTLHSNDVHLLGNVLIGGFLVHFLLRTFGTGLGLTLLLACGGIGNYINVMLQGTVHNSVGFSTAVFATIGILTGRQCVLRKNMARTILPPIAAGIGLLAMLGASGEHTDLGAHFFGLVVGFITGTVLAFLPGVDKLVSASKLQMILLAFSSGFMGWCWYLAWQT